MKAKVNLDLCIGCGMCEGICPNVFRLNDDGKAEAQENVAAEDEAAVNEAIENCPVQAIEG